MKEIEIDEAEKKLEFDEIFKAVTFNVTVGSVEAGISVAKQICEQIPNATINVFISHELVYNVTNPNFSNVERGGEEVTT